MVAFRALTLFVWCREEHLAFENTTVTIYKRFLNTFWEHWLTWIPETGREPHHTTAVLRPFFQDHPGEPVPEENFWTLWCKGRTTEADTLTIRLGVTPSGLSSANLHHPPFFICCSGYMLAYCAFNASSAAFRL